MPDQKPNTSVEPSDDQFSMQDPKGQYPPPPFPKQSQPEPGLAKEMTPKPDHGEESYKGLGRLKGRKALITGGDSGIGRAAAIAYAREGADVAIAYLPEEEPDAQEVLRLIQEAGVKALACPVDISVEQNCRDLINKVVKELGGLDILVNNAAKQVSIDKLADLKTDQLVKTFETNVFAMFWLTQEAFPHMPEGSAIINTTSIQAYQPSPNLLDYAATKAAIANFTHAFSQQAIEKGVRVNGVAPGPIWTPLQPSAGQPQEKIPTFGEKSPIGRAGQPAELASIFVYLASQESSYVVGEIIGVTGGQHLP
jgi:NAD(P)-dependent dehydrogenase (short-subunit alcohol dehydrogenase family)